MPPEARDVVFERVFPRIAHPEAVIRAAAIVAPEDIPSRKRRLNRVVRAKSAVIILEQVIIAACNLAVRRITGDENTIAPAQAAIAQVAQACM